MSQVLEDWMLNWMDPRMAQVAHFPWLLQLKTPFLLPLTPRSRFGGVALPTSLFAAPHALQRHFRHKTHLKRAFILTVCPQNKFLGIVDKNPPPPKTNPYVPPPPYPFPNCWQRLTLSVLGQRLYNSCEETLIWVALMKYCKKVLCGCRQRARCTSSRQSRCCSFKPS